MGPDAFHVWYDEMLKLLQQDGVEYRGSVSHLQLKEIFSKGGFL